MRSGMSAFAAVTGGYLAATTTESVLAPAFPLLAEDLDLGTGTAGVLFGVLAAGIAVGGLAGGLVLVRRGPRLGATLGLAVAAAGSFSTAASGSLTTVLVSQVVAGFGSGLFFASGLWGAATLGGRRRGLAMGVFGVAFSGGLALGAAFAALGSALGWRASFVAVGCLVAASAAAMAPVGIPRPEPRPAGPRPSVRRAFAAPLAVGGIAAASQYGTVAFLPLFAVEAWDVSPATAALLIVAARILSIPAKLISGNASDGTSAIRIAARLGLLLAALGLWWTSVPGAEYAAWAAVLFAAFVGGLGPIANVLALDRLEGRAHLLGAFRSSQIGIAAAASVLIGGAAELVGLRTALIVAAAVPASLALVQLAQARSSSGSIPS